MRRISRIPAVPTLLLVLVSCGRVSNGRQQLSSAGVKFVVVQSACCSSNSGTDIFEYPDKKLIGHLASSTTLAESGEQYINYGDGLEVKDLRSQMLYRNDAIKPISFPVTSRDGKAMVLPGRYENFVGLLVINLERGISKVNVSQEYLESWGRPVPSISNDPELVVYSDRHEVHIFDAKKQENRVVSRGDDASISPNGKYLCYKLDDQFVIQDLVSKQVINRFSATKILTVPLWSSDSRLLAYFHLKGILNFTDAAELLIRDINSGDVVEFGEEQKARPRIRFMHFMWLIQSAGASFYPPAQEKY